MASVCGMAHIDFSITKGARADDIEIRRASGAPSRFSFPKKGPIPHDAVHHIVETTMGLTRGFWGMVLEGTPPEAIQDLAKAAGHASASRARVPDSSIVQLLQAERLVECFEAELWGGASDGDTLRSVAGEACASSHVPMPDLTDERIGEIRNRIQEFAARWMAAPQGARFDFRYPG